MRLASLTAGAVHHMPIAAWQRVSASFDGHENVDATGRVESAADRPDTPLLPLDPPSCWAKQASRWH
jgi:hypothetical protein